MSAFEGRSYWFWFCSSLFWTASWVATGAFIVYAFGPQTPAIVLLPFALMSLVSWLIGAKKFIHAKRHPV